jgi:hypothetical protein
MERVIPVIKDGLQDPDRWLRVRDASPIAYAMEFYDLTLPRRLQKFFEAEFEKDLLGLAVIGGPASILADRACCSVTTMGEDVRLRFQPEDWPFECDWTVPRSDFVSAVMQLM